MPKLGEVFPWPREMMGRRLSDVEIDPAVGHRLVAGGRRLRRQGPRGHLDADPNPAAGDDVGAARRLGQEGTELPT